MQRRRFAVAAAVVASIGAAVAFTLPSMAETTPSVPKAADSNTDDVSPQILAAMRRDLGVNADQARAQLQRSNWASKVSARLAAQTGADFGGSWIAADGNTLKVAVTKPDAANQVRAAGGVPVMVARSAQSLDATKQKLDALRAKGGAVTGWFVDVPTNKLVVVAQPGATAKAQQLTKAAGVPAGSVTFQTSAAAPHPLADVRGADPYFISLDGQAARCSIGFSVAGGFVTAGHCGKPGTKTTSSDKQSQGVVKASVFPGNADMGFVAVNGNETPRPVVNDFRGNQLKVDGNTEAPIGATVCRSGSTTGTHCGKILAKNQTVNYPEGSVTGLTRTSACAEGGDSGGPWLSGGQAQGVTSGGSGNCRVGGETFFQPINEILATNKLTLLTTSNPTGKAAGGNAAGGNAAGGNAAGNNAARPSAAATRPPDSQQTGAKTADCTVQDVQREGALARPKTAQAQPNGGAFQANAGEQTACLNAPAGSNMGLFLQKFNGSEFETVAAATGAGDKQLTFVGGAGTYRYVVADFQGAGKYKLGFSAP